MPTHEVLNQPPPLQDYDPLACDAALDEALQREGAAWARGEVGSFARATATREAIGLGFEANQNPPRLRTHDRFGHRIDEVDFHPAWHELMRLSLANGVHCGPWRDPGEGAHVARAAKMLLVSQTEAGHGCPVSMTYSAMPALQQEPGLVESWGPKIASIEYDPRLLPLAAERRALIGMGMNEKKGDANARVGADPRRGRPGSDRHPGDGEPHAARLRAGGRRDHASGAGAGHPSLRAPARVRAAPDRAAADAGGARRSRRRVGGSDRGGDAP